MTVCDQLRVPLNARRSRALWQPRCKVQMQEHLLTLILFNTLIALAAFHDD